MNHIYQLVWNALHQAWVAVSEVASGLGSRSTTDQRHRPGTVPARFTLKTIASCAGGMCAGALFLLNSAQVSAQTLAPTTVPQGGVVVQGAATLQGAGSSSAPVLNINQTSQRAVIHWNSFNLGSASTVNFNQPDSQSATLNRVLDMQPSQIFGRIHAPGQVTLVNPVGVYFSPTAVLDVGALTATTLNQTDADFMAGQARFHRNGATGSVVNEGALTAAQTIALLAPEVRNQGTITASAVVMAAGESIQLNFDAFSRLASISVTPSQIKTLVENRTAVLASGGQIILSATALRGLQASVVNSGQIDASSLTAKGGRIVLEGDHIQLTPGSSLNASGATGGGTVLVGGDWQGSGSMVQATTVTMAQGATIDASATQSGDGGRVVLWSDVHNANSNTTVNGRITASGWAKGGQVETSGHTVVLDTAQVQAGGQGSAGLWLIDPYNYTIGAGQAATISASLSGGTSVTVDTTVDVPATGSSGNVGDAGDIAVNANISKTGGVDSTLTLRAHNDIVVAANVAIASTANRLNVVFNSDRDGSGAGAIALNTGSSITSNGGNITLGGGTAGDGSGNAVGSAANPDGVWLGGAALSAAGGNISMRGMGFASGSNNLYGVALFTSSTVDTTGAGNISIIGTGGAGTGTSGNDIGVLVNSGSVVTGSASGSVSVVGTGGGSAGSGGSGVGVQLYGGSIAMAAGGSGSVTVTGTGGGSSGSHNNGVELSSAASLTSGGGDVLVTGTAGGVGSGGNNRGVVIYSGTLSAGGSGTVTVVGTGGGGSSLGSDGINLTGASSSIASNGGGITLTGHTTTGFLPYGLWMTSGASIASGGNAPVSITADSVGIGSTDSISAGTGTVTVQNRTAGTLVNVGGADVRSGSPLTLGLTDAEIDRITAGTLVIGRTGATASGNMAVSASISPALARHLTLLAGSHITLNASTGITTLANGNVILNSDADGSGVGAILLNSSASITSNGGNITLGGGVAGDGSGFAAGLGGTYSSSAYSPYRSGVELNVGTVDAGGGNITMRGKGGSVASFGTNQIGIRLTTGTVSTSGAGVIDMTGIGGGALASTSNAGIAVLASSTINSGAATTLTGTGGTSVSNGHSGIAVDVSQVNGGTGLLSLIGTGGTSTTTAVAGAVGVTVTSGVVTGGAGGVVVVGHGGTAPLGGNNYHGVSVSGSTGKITSTGGNVQVTGTGGSSGGGAVNSGVVLTTGGSIANTGSGNTSVTGTANTGAGPYNVGVNVNGGSITSNSGVVAVTGIAGPTAGTTNYGVALRASGQVATTSGSVLITSDSYAGDGTESVNSGSGQVSLQNRTAGTLLNLGGADVLTGSPRTLGLSSAELNRITAGTLVVGRNDASAAGAITVSSAIAPALATNLTLKTGAGIAINAPVGSSTLTLTAAGNVSQTVAGNLTATHLLLNGVGANYALATASSNAVTTLAVGGTGATSYQNSSALQIGTVDGVSGISASGPVSIGTASGDLTVAQTVNSTDTSSAAVLLNAGIGSAAGTSTGGNILFSGSPGITTGTGGRATLMTGSVSGSTGLTAFIGSSSGRFRYHSDESATNYSTALGTGSYAVYREAPTVSVTAHNATKTYDGNAFSGGNGYAVSGLSNGDSLGGSIVYGGSSQGAVNVAGSPYAISASGLSSDLGYAISHTSGSLTVNPYAVSLSGSRSFDGTTDVSAGIFSPGTLVGSETLTLGGTGTVASKNVGTGKTVTLGSLALGNGTGLVSNYSLIGGTAHITQASLTVATSNVSKTYDTTTSASGTAVVTGGNLFGSDSLSGGSFAFTHKNVGAGNKTVTTSGVVVNDGNGGSNYAVAYANNTTSTITAVNLAVSGVGANHKTYDATTMATLNGTATVSPLGADVVGVGGTATASFADQNVGTGKTVAVTGYILGGADAANYTIVPPTGIAASITPASLTVSTANVVKTYDGTISAAGSVVATGGTLFGADRLSGGSFAFTDPGVGLGNKTVTTAGVVVDDGNGGNNYQVAYANNATSTIHPAPVTPVPPVKPLPAFTPPPALTREVLVPQSASPMLAAPAVEANIATGNVPDSAQNAPAGTVVPSRTLVSGCMGTALTGQDCGRSSQQNGFVIVTPVRNVSPKLSGQVMVQVSEQVLRNGAFEAALPSQTTVALRAKTVATRPDGQALPEWLQWDPQNLVLIARAMPAGALPSTVLVGSGEERVEVEITALP